MSEGNPETVCGRLARLGDRESTSSRSSLSDHGERKGKGREGGGHSACHPVRLPM